MKQAISSFIGRISGWKRSKRIVIAILFLIVLIALKVLTAQFFYTEIGYKPVQSDEDFRYALSVSPFTKDGFNEGYTYEYGGKQITSIEELEQLYKEKGATEMFVRIATKRHNDVTDKNAIDYTNATFDNTIELCKLAAKLNIPMNPELMCAYTYMDMEKQEAPDFQDYPEIYALQNGKDWSELSLEEIENVLYSYGRFMANEILGTGCTVNNWNLGNEANFGFAGVNLGLKNAVNPKLENQADFMRYLLPVFNVDWLENNLWKYNAKEFAAIKSGILQGYEDLEIDSSNVKFSTHIATVVMTPRACGRYFNCLAENGYAVDTAGISFYPSAPSMYWDSMILYKKTVMEINKKCGVPVFIAEFAYPSGEMSGQFAGWNKATKGYANSEEGQAAIYKDVIELGKSHGVIGIRYWAADYENWGTMPMFNFDENNHGTPKESLLIDIN
ncbi:MAG: glycosyl hydrolase 53 family protein [Pseudobutyrivibrio sp.]|nr:glycosyl hydrolase 53 family protein [Pseudobutyrivibrio sp.]